MTKSFKYLSLLILLLILTACSKLYNNNNSVIDDTAQQMKYAQRLANTPQPAVVVKPGYYVDPNTVPLNHNPDWTTRYVSLHARGLPFSFLLKQLLRYYPVSAHFDETVLPQRLVTINYKGSVKGALDALAASANYSYVVSSHDVSWSSFQTQSFDISFMPGTSNYLVGQDENQSNSDHETNSSQVNQINDQQYSNLQARLSVWLDLKKTLNQLKSKQGNVIVSESTTSVTVHDRPSNIKQIAEYINQLNRYLSQQVSIKVQILEVNLKKDFNYGINWNLLTNALGTKFRLIGNAAAATNLVNDNLITNSSNSALTRLGIGSNGTDVFINALSQQGKVRIVTEPEVVTMNNQIASIRITQSVGYIQSVSQTSNQNFTTSAISPGSITDGFTLYLLPKIQNDQVFMQITSTIANLERLEKVSNVPLNAGGATLNAQYQAIQVPTLSQKSFNQRSLVHSKSTLIIAGYKRLRNANRTAAFFGIDPLGGKGASSANIETLVLITPTILHSSRSNVHINTK